MEQQVMKIHAGTSGFGYREWKGKFYPERISPKEMLAFYSDRFDTVEINNTFYRMPKQEIFASWAEQVPPDFVFAVKAPQIITHIRRLKNAGSETAFFFRSLSVLERKLGPVLFQFPKSFHADHALFEAFLGQIPRTVSCAFEFRNPSWLDSRITDLLRKRGFSLCIADTDQDPAHEIISTADWGYLRLRRSEYRDADLSRWRERILAQQWKEAFVFFKHEEQAKGPELALRFRELAGSVPKREKAG